MDKQFRLPALMIIASPILLVIWYILNTDKIGTVLFGEKLHYCNVIACSVTRDRFFPVAVALGLIFIIGIILVLIRTHKGANDAKN